MENIKEKIEEIAGRLKSDKDLMEGFRTDPVRTVEELLGVDLPDDVVNKIAEGVKARISLDKLGDTTGGLKDKLKKLF